MIKVLVVEDHPAIAQGLRENLDLESLELQVFPEPLRDGVMVLDHQDLDHCKPARFARRTTTRAPCPGAPSIQHLPP